MLQIYLLLGAYILGQFSARAHMKTGSPDTFNDTLQALTLVAYICLTWVLLFFKGGLDAWPTILPFAALQVVAHLVFLLLKYLGGRGLVRRIDGFVTTLSTAIFTTCAMVIALPKVRGRYLEVLSAVCFGFPLLFAFPSLVKNSPPQDEVRRAAEASLLVYTRDTSDMFEEVEFIHNKETGARCGVYVDKDIESKTIYVAFAGSDSKVDWIRTNFDIEEDVYTVPCTTAPQEKAETLKVHKGFLKAWKSIEEPVWDKVSNVMLRSAGSGRVVVCGHSLGGAMATLASLDLFCKAEARYQKSLSVITFGSPTVGNTSFRDTFDAIIPKSIRVVTVYDPIPKTTINDFVHVKGDIVIQGLGASPHNIKTYIRSIGKP